MIRPLAICACALLIGACTKPQPPDKERPPEPQATELREAMQRDIQTARDAQKTVDDAARARAAAMEAVGG